MKKKLYTQRASNHKEQPDVMVGLMLAGSRW
jgi:hypothetical protein